MRKLYKYNLYELLEFMALTDIKDGEAVVVSGSDVLVQLERYDERAFITAAAENESAAAAALSTLYDVFARTHTPDVVRLYNALTAEYKPLDNYNMIESGTDNRGITRDYTRTAEGTANEGGTAQTKTDGTTTNDLTDVTTRTGTVKTDGTTTNDLTDVTTNTGTVKTDGTTSGKTTDGTTITTNVTEASKDEGTSSEANSVAAYDVVALIQRDSNAGTSTAERSGTTTTEVNHAGDVDTSATTASTVTNDTKDTTTHGGTVGTTQTVTNDTTDSVKSGGTVTTDSTVTNDTKDTTTYGGTVGNTQTVTNDTTDSVKSGGTVSDLKTEDYTCNLSRTSKDDITDNETTADNLEHTLTRSGNIGVTTSQQMLTSEIILRVRNQLIYYVVELFVSQHLTW